MFIKVKGGLIKPIRRVLSPPNAYTHKNNKIILSILQYR